MKRFLALAIVVMMIATIVPTTFAVPAQEPIDRQSMTRGREAMGIDTTPSAQPQTQITDFSNIKMKNRSLNTNGWMDTTPRGSYPMLDPEDTLLEGFWVEPDRFALADDWYTDGTEVLIGAFYMNDGVEGGSLYEFMEGETVWFNFDLYKTFDTGSQTLIPLDKEVALEAYVWAGTSEQYYGTDDTQGITLRYAWMSGTGSISCKVETPEDNYVYMFVVVIKDTTLTNTEWGAWLTPSKAEKENEFKNVSEGSAMTVGKSVTTKLGRNTNSSLTLAPLDLRGSKNEVQKMMYEFTYGEKHKIQLEGHKNYVAMFDSSDAVGIRIFFCDENMDVITSTYAGPGYFSGGGSYKDFAMMIMPVVSGTYYLVTCGYYMGDTGELEASIYNWNDVANPLTKTDDTIDLDSVEDGTVGMETGSSATPYAWGYFWYGDYGLGELLIMWPGTYTINGSNPNVYCDIYDGVHVIINGGEVGPIWAVNAYTPVEIEAKGNATISNTFFQFTTYNYEGYNAGVYFTGDNMMVTSSGNSQGAVMTANASMHILSKKFEVYCEQRTGYYPAAIWVTGKNLPGLTFGSNAQFDGDNRKCTMCYDGDGWFPYGYTVAPHDEVYRLHNQPDWFQMAYEFTVTTNGQVPDPSEQPTNSPTTSPSGNPTNPPSGTYYGDANLDGKVNTGDATMVLKHAAGMLTLDGQALANADINKDGKVNTGDATYILKVAAGMLPNPND